MSRAGRMPSAMNQRLSHYQRLTRSLPVSDHIKLEI